jgi:aryl-alcohol dehydrogenase-like predicted oxidoreductase
MSTLRNLGSLAVSVAGLGCDNMGVRLDERESEATIRAALECGVNHFDTADNYGAGRSEEYLGRALGASRDSVIIATKFGDNPPLPGVPARAPDQLPGGHPTLIRTSTEASLRRLDREWIDILWMHAPDPSTPVGDSLAELGRLISEGKVREIGCSNFSAQQIREADQVARDLNLRPFAAVQNEYSLLAREAEADALPACVELGLAFVPYWPVGGGVLSGKYQRGKPLPPTRLTQGVPEYLKKFVTDSALETAWRLEEFAEQAGHTLLELSLSWLAMHESVASVIVGASTPEQVRQNVAATEAWHLTARDRLEVDRIAARPGE